MSEFKVKTSSTSVAQDDALDVESDTRLTADDGEQFTERSEHHSDAVGEVESESIEHVNADGTRSEWSSKTSVDADGRAETVTRQKLGASRPVFTKAITKVTVAATGAIAAIGVVAWVGTSATGVADSIFGGQQFSGSLTVESVPTGADVVINGELRGRTPLELSSLERGDLFRIAVSKPGYSKVVRTLEMNDDSDGRWLFMRLRASR